jgi:hypothetical protein
VRKSWTPGQAKIGRQTPNRMSSMLKSFPVASLHLPGSIARRNMCHSEPGEESRRTASICQ